MHPSPPKLLPVLLAAVITSACSEESTPEQESAPVTAPEVAPELNALIDRFFESDDTGFSVLLLLQSWLSSAYTCDLVEEMSAAGTTPSMESGDRQADAVSAEISRQFEAECQSYRAAINHVIAAGEAVLAFPGDPPALWVFGQPSDEYPNTKEHFGPFLSREDCTRVEAILRDAGMLTSRCERFVDWFEEISDVE